MSCWIWEGGAVNNSGYGYASINGKVDAAHRHVLAFIGVPLQGRHVLHRCDVRLCCNPTHLFLGNAKINAEDCKAKGRQNGMAKRHLGSAHGRAKLTEADVIAIRTEAAAWTGAVRDTTTGRYKRSVINDLAQRYGVSYPTISQIVHRRIWRHV